MSLMRPFLQQPMMQQGLSQGLANFGTYQQMMLDMLRQAGSAHSGSASQTDSEPSSAANEKTTKAKATASSRSRGQGVGESGAIDGGALQREYIAKQHGAYYSFCGAAICDVMSHSPAHAKEREIGAITMHDKMMDAFNAQTRQNVRADAQDELADAQQHGKK